MFLRKYGHSLGGSEAFEANAVEKHDPPKTLQMLQPLQMVLLLQLIVLRFYFKWFKRLYKGVIVSLKVSDNIIIGGR